MHSFVFGTALGLAMPLAAQAASYTLATSYEGSSFFQGWNYSTEIDKNYGNVAFQSQTVATQQKLTYLNDAGNAIIKIDNTTVGNPTDNAFGRNSVFLTSNAAVNPGSLILMDAVHMPYGCSVWPAFFLLGADWPNNGEIDIFENVNVATANQYSLHTLNGCQHPATASGESGTIVSTDCFNATNGNQGCIVKESQENSFGAGFASIGGGGFATLFDSAGISTWFFPRASMPADFNATSPDPSKWGNPSAYFPASSCNITQYFGPQTIILDIDICGAFAGAPTVFSQGCTGQCVDLVRTPTNYDTAYFEIKSLKVFTEGGSTSGTATAPIPNKTSTGGSPSGTSSTTPNAANRMSSASWAVIGGMTSVSSIVALVASRYMLAL